MICFSTWGARRCAVRIRRKKTGLPMWPRHAACEVCSSPNSMLCAPRGATLGVIRPTSAFLGEVFGGNKPDSRRPSSAVATHYCTHILSATLNWERRKLHMLACDSPWQSPGFFLRIRTPFSRNDCARRTRSVRVSELLLGQITVLCCATGAQSSRSFLNIFGSRCKV